MWLFKTIRRTLFVAILVVALVVVAAVWVEKGGLLSEERAAAEFAETPPNPPLSRGALSPADEGDISDWEGVEDVNLAVPFSPQAPHANWDQPYQDACEEATIIMVERYLRGAEITLDQMDTEILKMVDFQNENYGFFKDSNIAETVRLAEAFYPNISAEAFYDVTADDIRVQLTAGKAVIVLVDGRLLGNPYFTQGGPDKHTLVIKGMQGDNFITNDPGTRRGADFVYSVDTVMSAIVDYDGDTPGTGKKAIIILTLLTTP